MNDSKQGETAAVPPHPPGSDEVHAALIARLSRIRPVPARVRSPQSMQPTPEAAKTRAARLRRKQQVLLQKSKRAANAQLNAVSPAPDPLAP